MKQFKYTLLLLILFFLTSGKSFSQKVFDENNPRWDQLPSTVLYPSGEYVQLPQKIVPFVRSSVPRVIRTKDEVLVVNPNIQVLPSPGVLQIETPIVCSRVNQNFMFGSSNIIQGGQINAGSFSTTNAGVSWFGTNYINNGNSANQRSDPGPVIDKNQRIVFTHITSNTNFGSVTGMGSEWSTNFGANFSATVQIENNGNVDKNLATSDDNPGSPYYGNTYIAYTVFSGSNANGHFSKTTDGGLSWSSALTLNSSPSGYFAQGHDVCARPNGDIEVCWTLGQQTFPYSEHFVGVARSTDGGATFTTTEQAYVVNGTRSFAFNGWNQFRINGFPRIAVDKSGGSRNGWIYIVTDEINNPPAGTDADVVMHRSTDGGVTWSAGIRVNQDAMNNGKVQFFPCVNVDGAGGVNVAYYDNRNFPSVGDSCSVFISRSLDGGNTWTDVEVADHHYIPKQPPGVGGGFDYMGVTSGNGKVWAFWSDDKSGTFNAWAGYITSGPPPAHDIAVGPFMNLPPIFLINNSYNIQTRIQNVGTSNETNVPIKFFINGSLINTTFKNLNANQVDSVSNSWNPTSAGAYTLMYVSALATDTNHSNDTVRTTVNVLSSLPGLCEGFNSTTFPPTNWSLTGAGTPYWSRRAVSGFGLGAGSAAYDMYNAANGTIGALNTLTFSPTSSGDSLKFDIAYCQWSSYPNDSLIILTSTNGGTSYSVLVRLGEAQMNTAPGSCTHPFIPIATDWGTRNYLLPAGTNKISFEGHSGFGDDVYLDSIGTRNGCNPVGISNNNQTVPKIYSLSQNYPNPFNPSTKIQFALPKSGTVKLVVYDILGAEVTKLINGYQQAGNHSVIFNGDKLASGVYFYKIEAGEFIEMKKMVLIK
jgi:hypothetical protein